MQLQASASGEQPILQVYAVSRKVHVGTHFNQSEIQDSSMLVSHFMEVMSNQRGKKTQQKALQYTENTHTDTHIAIKNSLQSN